MSGLTVEIIDMGKVTAALSGLSIRVAEAAEASIMETAERIFERSQIEVPKDTHALEKSGRIEESEISDGGEMTVSVAYGDEIVDYALIVHEDMQAHHEPPTKAKYVEDPARAEMEGGKALRRMTDEIYSAIQGQKVKSGGFSSKSGSWLRGKTGFIGSSRGL